MKLILTSAGFTTEKIIKKCEELVGKSRDSISVAIINEAYAVEYEDNLDWVLDDLNRVRDNFGGKNELVNLLALKSKIALERIELCDCIFVVGGHTDYLMSVFEKTGFSKHLPELLKTKVYIGSSAGSMVLGKRFPDECQEVIYNEHNDYGTDHFMNLVDLTILPHLDSPHFHNRREKLIEISKIYKGLTYGLGDDCAIVVNGDDISTIGSEPFILDKGNS